jgi:hypothetical protein
MRYRLRTLLIVLALGPPVLAGAFQTWQSWPIPDETAEVGRHAVIDDCGHGRPPAVSWAQAVREAREAASDENRSPLPDQ